MPDRSQRTSQLAETIRNDVEQLCSAGDRDLGTERNRSATAYVSRAIREMGYDVEELAFDVPEWRYGEATIAVAGHTYRAHPGPFSAAVDVEGPLVVIESAAELDGLEAAGSVLLLRGEIAGVQFTPRGYPFYQDAEHAAILDSLEATGALTVVAATGKNPSMTAGMSPFPLIEEPGFTLPTAYMRAEEGAALAARAGDPVRITIDSCTLPSTGMQPVGSRKVLGAKRVLVGAHVDSKAGTPGALDNASGVAVMLAAASLLREADLAMGVEFVPFNGEDHVLAPGEMAYLAAADRPVRTPSTTWTSASAERSRRSPQSKAPSCRASRGRRATIWSSRCAALRASQSRPRTSRRHRASTPTRLPTRPRCSTTRPWQRPPGSWQRR